MNRQAQKFPLLRLPSVVHREIVNILDPLAVINCLLTSRRMGKVIMLNIQESTDITLQLSAFQLELSLENFSIDCYVWKFIKSTVENATTKLTEQFHRSSITYTTYTTEIHCEHPEDALKKWTELVIKVFRAPISQADGDIQRMSNFGIDILNWLQTIQQARLCCERQCSYSPLMNIVGLVFRPFPKSKSREWTPEFKKILESRIV